MNRKFRFLAILMVLLAAFVFTGCDGNAVDGLFDSDNGGDGPTPTTVAVESVSLDKATMVLKTGTDGTLTATVLPENATDKSVTWSSDKPEVATVDQNGKVAGISSGTAKITVTTTDGAKTATCEVTVTDKVYTVSFDLNGKTGTAPDNQYVKLGEKVTEPDPAPTATGYTFDGWYEEATCTNPWNFGSDTINEEKAITLYAKWTEIPTYTISFKENNGSKLMDDGTATDGIDYTIPTTGYTAPTIPAGAVNENVGIALAGWSTEADGTVKYAVGAVIPAADLTDDMTLYAQWAKPVFTIKAATEPAKKVYFSKGNIWADNDKALHFETNQYSSASDWDASHVSHFTWSSTVEVAVGSSNSGNNLFCDENNKVSVDSGEAYYALTEAEWNYLLNSRTDAAKKVGYGTVCGVNGIILLPDVFTDPMKNNGTDAFAPKATTGWTANVYVSDNWAAMEAAGAVFLPAAGFRSGSNVNGVGHYGYCWSSTPFGSGSYYAYYLFFYSSYAFTGNYDRNYGQSVRLVCDVSEN